MKKTTACLLLTMLILLVSFANALESEPRLWIADTLTYKIYEITMEGDFVRSFFAPQNATSGLALDRFSDTLWGVSESNERIVNFDKEGNELLYISLATYAPEAVGTAETPEGVSTDPLDNTLWVVHDDDTLQRGVVYHIKKDGSLIDSFVTTRGDPWTSATSPQAITVDPFDGTLWITNNTWPYGIFHLTAKGDFINIISKDHFTDNRNLQGIAVDPWDGTLWVTTRRSDDPFTIFNITSEGDLLSRFESTTYDTESSNPTGIAVDGHQNFMSYCAYGYKDDPGIIIRPDAVVDCKSSLGGLRASKKIEIEERAQIKGNVVSQNANVELDKEVDLEGKIIAGKDAKIRDRSVMQGNITAGHNIEVGKDLNKLEGNLFSGNDVKLNERSVLEGDIDSGNKAEVKAGAKVFGDITAADEVKLDPDAEVSGAVSPYTSVPSVPHLPDLDFVQFAFMPGTDNIEIAIYASLAPSAYRDIKVKENAVITFSAGHYVAKKLEVQNDGVVQLDLTGGPVIVDVVEDVKLHDRVQMQIIGGGDASDVLFRIADGDVKLEKEGSYIGTFVAADGKLELQEDAELRGALYGKKVEVKSGATFTGEPALDLYLSITDN